MSRDFNIQFVIKLIMIYMMNQHLKRLILSLAMIVACCSSFAIEVEIDGVIYDIIKKTKTASLYDGRGCSGDFIMPEEIEYEGDKYKVTTIDGIGFRDNKNLTSINIPNSVTKIGPYVFTGCGRLKSISIPSSIVESEDGAFQSCENLKSVYITDIASWCKISFGPYMGNPLNNGADLYLNGELVTDINILPSSVTQISAGAFAGCTSLKSLTFPSTVRICGAGAFSSCYSVESITLPPTLDLIEEGLFAGCTSLKSIELPKTITYIGANAFCLCTSLESISIPNAVHGIGGSAFSECWSLKSIELPNSISTIEIQTFFDCKSLTSIKVPDQVTSISEGAFLLCESLETLYLPKSLKSIDFSAFGACENLEDVYCYATKAPDCSGDVFEQSYIEYSTLHVPEESMYFYRNTYPWNKFGTIVSLTPDEDKKEEVPCAMPTIAYENGEISFTSETEGAEFIYTITDDDVASSIHTSGKVSLNAALHISVYAIADGHLKSETATATLHWLDKTNEDGDQVQSITADRRPIIVSSKWGTITVKGLEEGESVSFYSLSGTYLGKSVSQGGTAAFTESSLFYVIVKIGEQSLKVKVE